jgi:hypothetical protein
MNTLTRYMQNGVEIGREVNGAPFDPTELEHQLTVVYDLRLPKSERLDAAITALAILRQQRVRPCTCWLNKAPTVPA